METLANPSKFDQLEAAIANRLPPGEVEMVHHFAPGVYAREMRIMAGTVLTGRVHKTEHLNIVCGDITVINQEDGSRKRFRGYHSFVSKPGTRRAGIAHDFTCWTCIHPTKETDLAKIEEEVVEKHYNSLLQTKTEAAIEP